MIFQNIISSGCITAQMTFKRFFSRMGPNVPLNFTGILECLRTIWTNPLLRSQSYWQELKSTRNSVKILKHTGKPNTTKRPNRIWLNINDNKNKVETKECSHAIRAQHRPTSSRNIMFIFHMLVQMSFLSKFSAT